MGRSAKGRPQSYALPGVAGVRFTRIRIVVDWPAPFGAEEAGDPARLGAGSVRARCGPGPARARR